MIKPNARFEKITDIPIDFFKENNIKGVILDVDNTLITLDKEMLDGVKDWVENVKRNKIEICIASNSTKRTKLDKISNELQLEYVRLSLKPLKFGLRKALKLINLNSNEVCEIGDQYFTDVIGAKRMGMFSILTNPISEEKYLINKLKRKIEKNFI